VKPGCRTLDPQERFRDPHDILIICSSLVTLSENRELRLAYYSVKEYFISERIRAASALFFCILEGPANKNIAEICLTYLLLFDQPDLLFVKSLQDFPLLDYAANYWF